MWSTIWTSTACYSYSLVTTDYSCIYRYVWMAEGSVHMVSCWNKSILLSSSYDYVMKLVLESTSIQVASGK